MRCKHHVIRYLMGYGKLKGKWFSEGPPQGRAGNYWWRKELGEYVDKLNKKNEVVK